MGDKLGFAVIGCGRIGKRRINALRKLDAKVVCIVDTVEKNVAKLAPELGCEHYTDFHKAVKRDDVDCVIVATPNKFHAPITIDALKNRKHVFCEKPLARNSWEARAMVSATSKNKVFLKTGSNLRYFSNVRKAKELLDKHAIGEPLFMRGWIGHDMMKWAGYKGRGPKPWFLDRDLMGGGTLLDNGVHILDLFRWFFGDFKQCFGYAQTLHLPIEAEDNAWGLFKAEDGRTAFIQCSWTEWSGYMYMEIYGTEGCIYVDNRRNLSKTVFGKPDGTQQVFDYSTEPPKSYELELKDYIQAIKGGRQPLASGYDGMKAIEMVQAVYESSKTGRIVNLP
jgi:predicted dehydrogenase